MGEDEAGSLSLGLTYKPFQDLDASSSAPIECRGALFVTVRQAQELPAGDWDSGQSDPYVLLKVCQPGIAVCCKHTQAKMPCAASILESNVLQAYFAAQGVSSKNAMCCKHTRARMSCAASILKSNVLQAY